MGPLVPGVTGPITSAQASQASQAQAQTRTRRRLAPSLLTALNDKPKEGDPSVLLSTNNLKQEVNAISREFQGKD
jgi:hypothetical protein